ncbi:MAG: hypothetical protein Q9214_004213 [Letrouitia sp. 1 TL-2023]
MKATWKPSWVAEARKPAFIGDDDEKAYPFDAVSCGRQKYLWGNVPALDVLNLQQNEGADFSEDLRLLFAASGDMRNVVKSLIELPATYTGHCEINLNDRDPDIVARNAILLLVAFQFSPEEATPIMLHIWYSALVPADILHSLQDRVLPLFQEVCKKIRTKPAQTLLSKTWTFGTRTLRMVLTKEQWNHLSLYVKVPDDLSMVQAQAVRASTTLAPKRKDYLDRALVSMPPAWRACVVKFRKDGILLPFGSSRREFDTPNPTFYRTANSWPMLDSADPLEGWPINEVLKKAPTAKNDLYGSLYFYLQDTLWQFCRQTGHLKVSIQLSQVDALRLPGILEQHIIGHCSFDRIELSNITDRCFLGPKAALATFSPLLKRKTENPSATIIAYFLNAVHEVYTPQDYRHSTVERLRSYIPITQEMAQGRRSFSPEFVKFATASVLFRDFDELFDRFKRDCRLGEISDATNLKIKSKHTIVQPWPFRIKENATQHEFDVLLASGHFGSERCVEWESAT